MKPRLLLLALATVFCYGLNGQDYYQINFAGINADPETVLVKNLTQNTELEMDGNQTLHLVIKGVSVDELQGISENRLEIFPNPSEHSCQISFTNTINGRVVIGLYSLSGKQLHQFNQELSAGKHTFLLSGVTAGSYLVKIQTSTGLLSGKFVATGYGKGSISLQHISQYPIKTAIGESAQPISTTSLWARGGKNVVEMDFWPGDEMQFIGMADGFVNAFVIAKPYGDNTYTFVFVPIWPQGYVHCDGVETEIVEVTNPTTGKTWMDRNLGASRVATASNDSESYGDLYQWGRFADGHQCRDSESTTNVSILDQPGNGLFITPLNDYYDWRHPQNHDLWQGVSGVNNPCPAGFRVPTSAELNAERLSWPTNNSAGAFNSSLKLPASGARIFQHGNLTVIDDLTGRYWSNSVISLNSFILHFQPNTSFSTNTTRTNGLAVRCLKDGPKPTVLTLEAISVTTDSAISGGNVYEQGFSVVTSKGVVWSLTENPTLENNLGFTLDGSGLGSFESSITGLNPETTYFVRAYATNYQGTEYGENRTFATPINNISVVTLEVSSITHNSAHSGGEVTNDGGHPVTARGVVWSQNPNPTLENNDGYSTDGQGVGVFSSNVIDLGPGTAYYIRAYATNSITTTYGNELHFGTRYEQDSWPEGFQHCNVIPTQVAVVINPATGRTWMDRNIGAQRVAQAFDDQLAYSDLFQWGRFADGHHCRDSETTTTLSATDAPNHANFIIMLGEPYDWRITPNNNLWQGVSGTNNPCPNGFRLPTEPEWIEEYESWTSLDRAGAFASNLKLPTGGFRGFLNGILLNVPTSGNYWSSTVDGNQTRRLTFGSNSAQFSSVIRALGSSVRCIKDEPLPNVSTLEVSEITTNSAISGGIITDDGGYAIIARGVIWSQSNNPLIENSEGITSDGVGVGTFSSEITGLEPGVAYYVRAYASNEHATAYGPVVLFGTVSEDTHWPDGYQHCFVVPTILVEVSNPITDKIWMDRNLGARRVATSYNDSESYGDLYQWGRFADGHQCRESSTTTTLSNFHVPDHGLFIISNNSPFDWLALPNNDLWDGANGINNPCPDGFRIPTEAELNAERDSWVTGNSEGAFGSPLKLPSGGLKLSTNGVINNVGNTGRYWSNTTSFVSSRVLEFAHFSQFASLSRASGASIRCIKHEQAPYPTVVTAPIIDINSTSATSGGEITKDGGSPVSARGVVWSQSLNPTIVSNDGLTTDGTGSGVFTSSLIGLIPDKTYYVRAYATNDAGTAYGNQQVFETGDLFSVTTAAVNNISNNSVLTGGTVSYDGTTTVYYRGVVWATEENPTLSDNVGVTHYNHGIGEFQTAIIALEPNQSYYARAYATNYFGTVYGENIQFTTTNEEFVLPDGMVNCGFDTEVKTVINPSTGKTWMDRNLGASRVATATNDSVGYGDLYQWGRFADGHQCRNSEITATLSESDTPGHGLFIINENQPFDWRSESNNNLWQGVEGVNNPCPSGFRIPTQSEWDSERLSWSFNPNAGIFASPLKLSFAGVRWANTGFISGLNINGYYWSSTVDGNSSISLMLIGNHSSTGFWSRGNGSSVRCIKDE